MILTEKLTINGTVRDVAGFTLKTPTGGLGQSLTIALTKPDLTLIPDNALIKFEIGVGVIEEGEVVYSWVTVLDNGRLNGLNYSAGWVADDSGGYPNDIIEFNTLSPLADKLGLSPSLPVIMFNPQKIDGGSLIPEESLLIRTIDESNNYTTLTPILEEVENLSFYQALDRAYTDKSPLPGVGGGCNFSQVITNIPNFPIDRVDFSLESGWHSPVASLYSAYEPVVFEDGNILYIISPEFGLPPGFTPTPLNHRCVISINRNQETQALINAILLTYNQDASGGAGYAGEIPSIETIIEPVFETGESKSYSRTEVEKGITVFKDINTGEIRRIQENYINTKVYAWRPNRNITTDTEGNVVAETDLENGAVVLVSEENIENSYIGVTKSGHTRTTKALYLNPDIPGANYAFGVVERENNTQKWRPDLAHPGEYELERSITTVSGLCLVEDIDIEEVFPPTGQTVKYIQKVLTPILDAVDTGLVTGNGKQTLADRDLYTVIETLRDAGQNQSNTETRIINHLTGGVKPPKVNSRPGSKTTYVPPFSVRYGGGVKAGTIRELIKNQDSIDTYGLRKVVTLDIGKLDPVEGRKIARRRLKVYENPPRFFEITLPGINFFYRRGSIIKPPLRSGFDRNCIITGTTITGQGLHTANALREMRLEARELVNVNN